MCNNLISQTGAAQDSSNLEAAKNERDAAKKEYDRIEEANSLAVTELEAQYSSMAVKYQRAKRLNHGQEQVTLEKSLSNIRVQIDKLNGQITEAMLASSKAATKYYRLLRESRGNG